MLARDAARLSDLLAPPTLAGRLELLRDEGADESVLLELLDDSQELIHGDPATADALAELCGASGSALELPAVQARACYQRARISAERGELDRALELIDRARAGWLEAGDRVSALRSELGRMQLLDDLGEHRQAASVGEALLSALGELDESAPDPDLREWLRASALGNVGVAYGFIGEHEWALAAYAESEATYRALGMLDETAKPLANRGIELLELGRAREALGVLRDASSTFEDAGDRLWAAKCAVHVARAHLQLGAVTKALRTLELARLTLDELEADAEAARVLLAISGAYLEAGLFGEAAGHARAASKRTAKAGMVHDTALAAFTAALADLGANRLDDAAIELRRAAELFERVGDRQHQAKVLLAEADVAAADGRRVQAAALAAAAAAVLDAGGWLIPLVGAKLRQADLADDDMAVATHLDEAAALIEQLRLPHLRHAHQVRLAALRRREGRLDEAERLLREAIAAIQEIGGSLPDSALRTAFRSDHRAAHDALVDVLVSRGGHGDLLEACHVGDQAKAPTLLDLANGSLPAGPTSAAGTALEQRRADFSAACSALLADTEPTRRALLRRRVGELEREVSALRIGQTVLHPDPVVDGGGRPGSASGAIGLTPTLGYHVCGPDVFAFVADGEEIAVRRLAGAVGLVDAELDRLAAQWSRFSIGAAFARRHEAILARTTRECLSALHRLLIQPVGDLLDELDCTELTIVPHHRLGQVPFHALHDGQRYLNERWAFTVSPTMGGATPERSVTRGSGALVLAVPDARAPAVEAEAHAVAGLLPDARVFVGDNATTDRLRSETPGPGIVHIACHGLYRPANPLFSSLKLADRWLTSAEILELDLAGALVTLSACESGRPARDTAEPVGLAWAFLAAGASGAIVSQWVVNDDATSGLMLRVYRELAAGQAPPQALRQAQLSTAAEHPHPYFWAPFTYVGSPAHDESRRS